MKPLLVLLLLAIPVVAQEQALVARLPSASINKNKTYLVTDSLTVGDCVQGGGIKRTRCISNGTIWQSDVDLPDATIIPTDTTHRFVTDTEKSTWSGKQNALGFTPANVVALAAVATSGAYADLTGKPTIPAAQVQSDWNAGSGLGQILNKPTLAASATTDTTNANNVSSGVLAFARGGNSGSQAAPATTGAMSVAIASRVITLTPTGACTLNATGGAVGQTTTLVVTTSGTSSFVITFGTNMKSVGTLATGTVTAKTFAVTFLNTNGTQWVETGRTAAQ